MNALINTLSVLDTRPSRITDFHTELLNDNGLKVRWGYRITQHGRKNRTYTNADGLQLDEGQPTEVTIIKAWLMNTAETVETAIPLSTFSPCDLTDAEERIAAEIDAND